jgi:uncharacterized protein YcfL
MFNIKKIGSSLLIASLLVGCANQNSQMDRGEIYDKNKSYSNNKVSFVDDMDVLVSDIKTIKQGNFLKVMIEFINEDDADDIDFVYQIEWYDQDGILKDTTSWRQARVIGNQKLKVSEMATHPSVVNYKIVISTKK